MKDTSYLALTGELWGVFREFFGDKLLRYIESVLHCGRLVQLKKGSDFFWAGIGLVDVSLATW